MTDRFKAPAGIVLMLLRKKRKTQVLLQRRKNTGFADGLLDLSCSGHVEINESMTQTVLRECREELGITLQPENIRFVCFIHKKDGDLIYYYGYFICSEFSGQPQIMECEKCSELIWCDIDNLPQDLIPDRLVAVEAYLTGSTYIEYGW